jgi:hypothetical protein
MVFIVSTWHVILRKQQPLLQLRKSLINSDGQSAFKMGYTLYEYPSSLQRTENITNRTVTRGTLIILRHNRAPIATHIHCYACVHTVKPRLVWLIHWWRCVNAWLWILLGFSSLCVVHHYALWCEQWLIYGLWIGAGIAMGYGPDGRSSIPGRGKRFFSIPQRPELLWGPPSPVFSAYRG